MKNANFFAAVRRICGKLDQTQVDSINGIMREAATSDITNPNMLGYMLSTGWNECRLRPVREGFKKTDKAARAYVRKQGYNYAKEVNGHVYYGRGLVQLTHFGNYLAWGIEDNPDKALEPAFAAKVLVTGMLDGRYNGRGKGLGAYLGNGRTDWKNARRTVNITDKWQRFRDTAKQFAAAIDEHGFEVEHSAPAPEPAANWLTKLISAIIEALFGRFRK